MNKYRKLSKWILNIFFIIIAFIALFPLISLIISSFRPSSELMRNGITFSINWSELSLNNYIHIFTESPAYWEWYGNSLIISGITIVLSLFFLP